MSIFLTSKSDRAGSFWDNYSPSFWDANAPPYVRDAASNGLQSHGSVVVTFVIVALVLGVIGFLAGAYPSLSMAAFYLEWPLGFS